MFHLRKKKTTEEGKLHYEEKKFSFGVIILIVMMTVFLISLGERALSDLGDGIPRVEYPYNEIEELPEERAYQKFYDETVSQLINRKRSLESQIRTRGNQYDTSLLENIAGEKENLYGNSAVVRTEYTTLEKELVKVNALLTEAEVQGDKLREAAKEAREPIYSTYKWEQRWRQAKVFAWEVLFWLPFFLVALFWHTRVKQKESKWEPVSISVFITASFLSLQSLIIVLWSWIPHEIFEWLWEILRATILTRIVGYYFFIALAVFFFGGFIVLVHKRMSNPLHGGKKKIRQGLCPQCSYPLNLSGAYCGGCSRSLMKQCSSCKKDGYTWQSNCVHCGKN